MESKRINKYSCPHCGKVHDSVTKIRKGKGNAMPTSNTFSICVECGGIVRFMVNDNNYSVRKVDSTELEELRQVAPEVYATLMRGAILTKTRPRSQKN